MHIVFASSKLQKEFEDDRALQKKQGKIRADKIKKRMLQLESATPLAQLRNQPGKFHELTGDRKGFLACDLDQPYRLIFAPADEPVPKLPNGGLDWEKVTSVCIHEVVNYHD